MRRLADSREMKILMKSLRPLLKATRLLGLATVALLAGPLPATSQTNDGLIAFMSDMDGSWELYRIAPDGRDLRRLTDNRADDRYPAWHPSGESIAFASDLDGSFNIYVMPAAGGDPRPIIRTKGDAFYPAWQPDVVGIAFLSD